MQTTVKISLNSFSPLLSPHTPWWKPRSRARTPTRPDLQAAGLWSPTAAHTYTGRGTGSTSTRSPKTPWRERTRTGASETLWTGAAAVWRVQENLCPWKNRSWKWTLMMFEVFSSDFVFRRASPSMVLESWPSVSLMKWEIFNLYYWH